MSRNSDIDDQEQGVEYDEWGDPVKQKDPESKRLYTDEWGDPVKRIGVNEETREFYNEQEKLAAEKELVKEGRIYPRAHYLPRGRLRGIVAVCLAFVFGMIFILAALIGGGYYVGTQVKLSRLLGKDAEKYLTEDYIDMTIVELILTIADDMQDGIDTLDDIAKYTPLVDTLLDQLDGYAEQYGIPYDRETVKTTKFNQLGSYFMDDVLKNIEVGKVLTSTGFTDPMVIAIFYGEEDEDYEYDAEGNIVPIEGGRAPVTVNDLNDIMGTLGQVRLGTLMGINKDVTEDMLRGENAMMYSLCYGKYSKDYTVENGKYVVHGGDYTIVDGKIKINAENLAAKKTETQSTTKAAGEETFVFPTLVDDLINSSNTVINTLELGAMLGISGGFTQQEYEDNAIMYALAYGTEGKDYDVKWENGVGEIVLREDRGEEYPTTVKALTENSNDLIQGMEVETLMGIKPNSDKVMHYLAYGPEMAKGTAPYTLGEGGKYTDADGQAVDEFGYLLGEDGKYKTEFVKDAEENDTTEKQYAGGGRYVYTYGDADAEGVKPVTGIQMLPDPNDPAGMPYPKRTVKDLTGEDAGLFEGMKIGDVMEIDSNSSNIMQAMKDWTIDDLGDQDKINKLHLSDILEIDENSSGLMKAMESWELNDLNKQEKIEALSIGTILDVKDKNGTSNIIWALREKTLKDLENQNTIERLRIGQLIEIKDDTSSRLMKALKTWRISDLSDQSKIDSLKLSDVIEIGENETGILASLKDSRIGKLQDKIDTLTLKDMLGDNFGDNKILNHLADSTVATLSADMEGLSVADLFTDEVFSYMELNGKTYQELYNDYFTHHAQEDAANYPRPQKVTFTENDPLITYYTAGEGVRVVKGFYEKTGNAYTAVPEGAKIIRGMKTVSSGTSGETGEQTTTKVPYFYYEKEIPLQIVKTYKIVVYNDKGDIDYGDVVAEENVTSDDFGNYYTKQEGSDKDVEVELFETYKLDGNDYEGEVIRDGDRAYYIEKVEVFERYGAENGAGTSYDAAEVTEHYEYEKDGQTVQLERYVSGVWFLLIGHTEGEVAPTDGNEGTPGTVLFDADVKILDIAGKVTAVDKTLTTLGLWKLYFHEIMPDDPSFAFAMPIPFEHGETVHTVQNLNDVTISELVPLIRALTSEKFLTQYLEALTSSQVNP